MPQGVWILLLLRLPGLIASLTATDPVFRRPRNADNKPRGKWGKGEKGRCVFPNLRLLPTLQSLFPYRSLSSRAGKVEGIRLPTLMTFSTRYKLCLSLLHLLLSLSSLPLYASPCFFSLFLSMFFTPFFFLRCCGQTSCKRAIFITPQGQNRISPPLSSLGVRTDLATLL